MSVQNSTPSVQTTEKQSQDGNDHGKHMPDNVISSVQNSVQRDTHSHIKSHTRRRLVAGSVAAGFAQASAPVWAQAVKTDFAGIKAGESNMPAGQDSIPVYMARPDTGTGPWPVVVVVSEIFGVHEYIADVCRRFAKAGYMAVAPEFFYRIGDPGSLATIAEIQSQIVSQTADSMVMADIGHALDWAGKQGGDLRRAAITGFCWGGRITWLACAHHPQLKAGVAWYGRLTGDRNERFPRHPLDVADTLKAPVLGLYGSADTGIPMPQVEQMQRKLRESNNPVSRNSHIRVFVDAPHAFHADYRATYREGPAREGWADALAWLKQHMT